MLSVSWNGSIFIAAGGTTNYIVTSTDGRIYFVDLNTGKKIWSYEIGSAISSTPAVIDNMIIVGAEDGRVYAFEKYEN